MRRISLRHEFVPIYETISYCWGPPRPPSTIRLNGHLTPVPASSEAALRRMRLSGRPRTLWIDAVCIDQSSVTERSEQVAFMSTVYRSGIRNLVYLGEDDGMARRGVKAIQDVVTDMRTATADMTLLSQTIHAKGIGSILASNEGFSEDVDFEALEALFSISWFRPLSTMLELARRFEKTEARDGAYAILGIIDRDNALGDDGVALLKVDYTKSIPDVLRDATRYALCEDSHANVLCNINHQVDVLEEFQTFSTWTVRADLVRQPGDAAVLPDRFHACKGLEASSLLSDVSFDKTVLLLQGIAVDQVVQTTIVCHQRIWDDYEGLHQWLGSIKDMTIHDPNIAMQEKVDLAIASTVVIGKTRSGTEAQPDDLQVLVEYIKGLAIREDGIISDGVSVRPTVDHKKIVAVLKTVDVWMCKDRRFFITAAGFMGLGPRCMKPEDIVVVVRGSDLPFILRKKVDGYWLIGPAYVHGMMYGEAVQMHRSRGESEVVFHVR
ncbi:unnamed protein product [Alternaria alternata]